MSSRKGIKTIDNKIRMLAISAINKGKKIVDVARKFELNSRTLATIFDRYKKTGLIEASARGRRKPKLDEEVIVFIRRLIDEDASIKLKDIKKEVREKLGISTCVTTIHKAIQAFH